MAVSLFPLRVDGWQTRFSRIYRETAALNLQLGFGHCPIANPTALGLVTLVDGVETIPLLDLVNNALNSAYGQQQTDTWHRQHMADLEAHVNFVVNSVTDLDRRAFLQGSLAARLFFADIMNQFGPFYGRSKVINYLNSSVTNPVIPEKLAVAGDALGYDDILNYYFGIPANYATARADRIRRFGHTLSYAAEQLDSTALDDEVAKGLVRLYQDYLKGYEQASGFQEITSRLINPARKYLTDTYVQAKGYSVTINGRVIVGEDPATFTRNPKHFSEHDWLVGTSNNDLIFGDGGNDTIFSSGGSDVLYGGKGNDNYVVQNYGDGGQARIEDKEGDNTVVFNGIALKYFVKKSGETVFKDLDQRFTAVKQGTDLLVTDTQEGNSILLNEDFQSGDFGIRLIDLPGEPAQDTAPGPTNPWGIASPNVAVSSTVTVTTTTVSGPNGAYSSTTNPDPLPPMETADEKVFKTEQVSTNTTTNNQGTPETNDESADRPSLACGPRTRVPGVPPISPPTGDDGSGDDIKNDKCHRPLPLAA